ncbi:hypothetical protein SBRCBS47491_002447 [Sporothrix bragantina]|uniref:Sodium/calcium exchanger membrane region domain-containing protein n=1 Tax=Sporothrix bragantina TaxID=671064 RepID=A0ABP0B724_9PEZI
MAHSSRRVPPGVDASRTALSESNLLHYEQQQQQLKQQSKKTEQTESPQENSYKDNNNNNNNGGPSVQQPVNGSGSGSNTGVSSPGDNTTAAVSPASTSSAPLQEAWPGPVLEDARVSGGSGKEKEKEANAPPYLTSPVTHPVTNNTTNTANRTNNTPAVTNNANPVDPPKDDFTAVDLGQTTTETTETAAGTSTETEATASKGKQLVDLVVSFFVTSKKILFYSWLNVFLVFVPAGIIVGALHGMPPAVVFSINAIAIIPLAGLLGFATETVAYRMGDSIGALLNITFGNAVELIIFMYVPPDEIRIVQASLLGSILANLLLILGMSFLLGGLRFREQIYNSTVTQMSACLLSLSVISLVLPTAFHASFRSAEQADRESLKISRGTSVILLMVYGIYLLFQLKSHAYMYESTPQHIIDEESTPGPAAGWLDSSSSDDSSSSSSDSDTSGHSRDTMKKRMRRVIRGGRRRKSSVASLDTADSLFAGTTRSPSFSTATAGGNDDSIPMEEASTRPSLFSRVTPDFNEEAIDEDDTVPRRHKKRHHKRSLRRYRKGRRKSGHLHADQDLNMDDTILETAEGAPQVVTASGLAYPVLVNNNRSTGTIFLTEPVGNGFMKDVSPAVYASGEPRRVDFAIADLNNGAHTVDEFGNPTGSAAAELASARRAFNLRAMSSLRPVAKSLAPTVFTQPVGAPPLETANSGPIPRIRYGIRHTNSLPDPLSQQYHFRPPGAMLPSQIPPGGFRLKPTANLHGDDDSNDLRATMSRKAAILLLLITTGLVAACAEFMVSSINGLVATSSVGEVFIGLIILPIVGNAAEHVTAVMVAMKNKMDLAIGVAVGSSIQIALFMTPLVVILGWIIGRDMTLYFTLFETVCLFVSAFIVNFLVLDGRSNYLEGALLCTTYVIISLVAFFYPKPEDASSWG